MPPFYGSGFPMMGYGGYPSYGYGYGFYHHHHPFYGYHHPWHHCGYGYGW